MHKDVLSFNQIRVNNDLLKEIWTLDPRKVDALPGHQISVYAVALSQYLVFLTCERNKSKAEIHKLSKLLERTVSLILGSDRELLKKYKTKTSATDYIITNDDKLMGYQSKLEELRIELIYIDGIDKSVSELIATLKRELTRRENELYAVRQERK